MAHVWRGRFRSWRKAKRQSRNLVAIKVRKRGGGRKEMEIAVRKILRREPW